jgi:hypothetical protein
MGLPGRSFSNRDEKVFDVLTHGSPIVFPEIGTTDHCGPAESLSHGTQLIV